MIKKQPVSVSLITASLLILLTGCGSSSDTKSRNIIDFDIRGISPGMSVQEACDSLAVAFPNEDGLKKKVGIPRKSEDWRFNDVNSIRKGRDHGDSCFGRFKGFDATIVKGSIIEAWTDKIKVQGLNGDVYSVSNKQSLIVGKNENDCAAEIEKLTDSLVEKYGEPTDDSISSLHAYLSWDYSLSVTEDDIGKDLRQENYTVEMKCEMYTAAHLSINSLFFSGDAKKNSYAKTEITNTHKPSL